MSDTSACLAIDIGGTKMAVAAVTPSGEILESDRSPTPAGADAEAVFAVLARLVDAVRSATSARLDRCGVGSGGPMSAGGESVSPINIPAWREFPLRQRLGQLTGLSVVVDNDAKALALAEGWKGSAQGMTDYLSMVVSTGVGGGIVSDGRLVDGATGNAGHIGHVTVEPDGHPCGCGARGCLEAEASGTAIARITGAPPAEAGPEVVERTGRLVGRAVASVANLLDLDLAVVGGSVALGYGEAFFRAAQAELSERALLSYSRAARVVPSGLGATGGLIGAARLAYVRPA